MLSGKNQPISFIVLVLSLIAHGAAFLMHSNSPFPEPYYGFLEIFTFFAAISFLLTVAIIFSPSLKLFRILIAFKALILAGVAYSIGTRFPQTLLLLLPALVEIAVYERPDAHFFMLAGFSLFSCAFYALSPGLSMPIRTLVYNLSFAITAVTIVSVLASLIGHYRANLVLLSKENVRLNKAVAELSVMNINYQSLAVSAMEVSAKDERLRLTRELHDALGYALTNIAMMMEAGSVTVETEPLKAKQILGMAKQQAMDGLTEVRRVLYALRGKEDAKPRGLHAIDRLIAIFKVASQAEVQVDYTNAAGEWDERSDAAVFYFVREALTNAMKHGGANRISVLFQIHEETLEVIVEDDGAGASDVKEGIGLTGMRERFGPLGGTLSYSTGPVGFEIRATIPLKEG